MQPLATGAKLSAYHARLQSSHDFKVYADILDLNERMVGTGRLLDGQVNIQSTGPIRRTASLTLSDPAGALDFRDASAWSGTSLWVDRLVRIRHVVTVPGFGEVTAVPMVGYPTGLSRQGGEVQVELADKAALATRGARPYNAPKGALATTAIRNLMAYCTGEFRFRVPTYSRRLALPYSVGLTDEASPMTVASKIARNELGMQLLYSCDGYLTLRPLPQTPVADMGYVTDQASTSADFTNISNYVRVSGTRVVSSVYALPSNPVSTTRLERQGVPGLRPLVVSESAYTRTTQTATRASSELAKSAGVNADVSASVVPMFHLDADDVVTIHMDEDSTRTMRLSEGSIPLGVGGDMTLGFHRWVSSKALGRPRSQVVHPVRR